MKQKKQLNIHPMAMTFKILANPQARMNDFIFLFGLGLCARNAAYRLQLRHAE